MRRARSAAHASGSVAHSVPVLWGLFALVTVIQKLSGDKMEGISRH